MAYLPSFGDSANTLDVWKKYPDFHRYFAYALEEALRKNEEIGPGPSEFVFAYISYLNSCEYCYGSHAEVSKLFGIGQDVMDAAIKDPASSEIDPRLSALLVYAKKATLDHANLNQADAQAVMDAGWSEEAMHHLIVLCGMGAFMNRFTIGLGLDTDEEKARSRGKLLQEWGYAKAFGPLKHS